LLDDLERSQDAELHVLSFGGLFYSTAATLTPVVASAEAQWCLSAGVDLPDRRQQRRLEAGRAADAVSVLTEIRIGSEFVGYRIDELIGRGGMGVVYRASDLRLKRTVALKLMAPELALDQRFRERFSREAELAMSLEHPNVVPIHDAGDIDGRLYLAMRHVEGVDLRALLQAEGPFGPARALAICGQVAKALDAAHAKGLVHRDVKPSNVLLDASEHVYLADFGLTRRLDEQGPAGAGRSVGTPAYLAPEQIEGGQVDGRTDVYSLGCLLYECLTGETPFARGSRLEIAWAHLEEEPPRASKRRPELGEAIDPVIRKAMAKDPEDRYQTCAALIGAAEGALGLRGPPSLHRRRALLVIAAVLAALSVAAVAAVLTTRGHAKAATPLFARYNTLARIDPETNRVSAVIDVGSGPVVAAAGGHSVWVFNQDESTISEIDARTNRIRKTTAVPDSPVNVSRFAGPALAADASGAWFVNGILGLAGARPLLTRVLPGGRGKRQSRLDVTPTGVAAGDGAVWVVGRGAHDYQVLRIDASTGRVETRTRFPASKPIDSIGLGYGAVWVVGSADATLYRIDARTAKRDGQVILGTSRASRPEIMTRGHDIWVRLDGSPGRTTGVDPSTLTIGRWDPCCSPEWGEDRAQFGSLWWYTWSTGSLFRQEYANGPVRTIHVTSSQPDAYGPCLTSIAIGSGSLWLTAASSPEDSFTCPPD
jgi:serine/threonine-protein kinase